MYLLEIKTAGSWETYVFGSVERVMDYIYMVEGESYLPEYRAEFQRKAPGSLEVEALAEYPNLFCGWEIGTEDGKGAIKYVLSYITLSSKHRAYNFPKVSRFWSTMYGAMAPRVEKELPIDVYHMGVN